MEQEGHYNDAVNMLAVNNRRNEALECAERYENEGKELRSDLQASILAIRFAKEICNQGTTQGSRNRLAKLVKYMNNPMDCLYYLRIARKHRDAFNILCNEKRFDEACRICAAQGWLDDGLKLAEEKKKDKWVVKFIFQKVTTSLVQDDTVDAATVTKLHSLKNSKNDQIKAKACLLLGKSNHDFFLCRRAFGIYVSTRNAAGCIEAFNLMTKFRIKGLKSADLDLKQILNVCSKATDVIRVLESIVSHRPLSGAAQEHTLTLLQEFYGLQRQYSDTSKSIYFLAPKERIWIDFCTGQTTFDTDLDGMIQIDCVKAQKIIMGHVQGFLQKWKKKDELQACQMFRSRLNSFQFHKQLEDKGCIKRSFKRLPLHVLPDYLQLCCTGFQLSDFANGEIKCSYITQLLINFYKPTAALYFGLSRRDFEWIARSSSATLLEKHSIKILQTSDQDFYVDDWLEAWGILSILGKYHLDHLLRQLDERTEHANTLPGAEVPHAYVHDRSKSQSGTLMHIISMWVRSCILIQSDKRVIASSKVVLRYFLEVIARRISIRQTLSVTNLVNVLTIHTTALLSLTALCNYIQQKSSGVHVLVPNSYERVLNVFDCIGKQVNKDCIKILDACMGNEKVLTAHDKMKTSQYAVQHVQAEITKLLWRILNLLLGLSQYTPHFQPLKEALKSDDCIRRGEARHCLLLTLVLFGNLTEIDKQRTTSELLVYQKCINDTFKYLKNSAGDDESQVLHKAYSAFSPASNSTGFFTAINHLITAASDPDDHIARFKITRQPRSSWRCELERASIRQLSSRPLLSAMNKPPQVPVHGDQTEKSVIASQNIIQSQVHSGGVSATGETPVVSLQQAVDESFSFTVSSHPASAQLMNSTNPHETESMSAPQQNVMSTPSDNFSPPTPPTEVAVTLTSQISIEPREGEKVQHIEEDEDLKDLELAAPFIRDKQNSKVSTAVVQQGKSATMAAENISMVDEQFCRFCAVSLRVDDTATPLAKLDKQAPDEQNGDQNQPISEAEDQAEQVELELYESHCCSERHINNMKAHEIFTTCKKEDYEPLKEKLRIELKKLKEFETKNITSNLRTIVQDIEVELEKNERELTERWHNAEWRMGASRIQQDMQGCMEALIKAAQNKLSKEQARVLREHRLQEQAVRVAEEAIDEENLSDEGERSQSEEEISKEVDANVGREKSRQQKRNRKKQTKASRHVRKK
jgi:hypothetical protein